MPQLFDALGKFIANVIQKLPANGMSDAFQCNCAHKKTAFNISNLLAEQRVCIYSHISTNPRVIRKVLQAMKQTDLEVEFNQWCAQHLLALYSPIDGLLRELFPRQDVMVVSGDSWYREVNRPSSRKVDLLIGKSTALWRPCNSLGAELPFTRIRIGDEYNLHQKANFFVIVRKEDLSRFVDNGALRDPLQPLYVSIQSCDDPYEISRLFMPMKVDFRAKTHDGQEYHVPAGRITTEEMIQNLKKVAMKDWNGDSPENRLSHGKYFIYMAIKWQEDKLLRESLPGRFEESLSKEARCVLMTYYGAFDTELGKLDEAQEKNWKRRRDTSPGVHHCRKKGNIVGQSSGFHES
jgi:hypothetical protein